MKEITTTISNATYDALVTHCHRSNAAEKTDLTFDQWHAHLLEGIAIADDLAKAINACRPDIEAAQLAITNAHIDDCRAALLEQIRKD